jgi:ABC-type transport system involved in multi-copper enzyme maturation permease subunit
MLLAIARFEARYLLRNPLVWITAALTFAGFFASMNVEGFELGSEGGLHRNASYAIVRNLMMLSLMYMPVITAFVANAVLRDDETGYGPIIRTTRITRVDYLIGRFIGALVVVAGCLAVGALGLWLGTFMPWANQAVLGPNRLAPYLFGLFVVSLPNLFIGASVLFVLAAVTRSMMSTYLGVIAFTSIFFFVGASLNGMPHLETVFTLGDPFGVLAIDISNRYWTSAERNVLVPAVGGVLLANRLLWISVGVALLAAACTRFRFTDRGLTRRDRKRQQAMQEPQAAPAGITLALPAPTHDGAAQRTLLWLRTRFESWQIVSSPAFPVLLAWGLFTTLISLTTQRDPDGRPTYPTTLSLIPELENGMELMPLLVAIYFAGELVWRERDRRMHEIVDASPIPNWTYVVPKALAMALVLVSIMLVSVLAAVSVQLSLGYTQLELGRYLLWFVLPMTWDMFLLAAIAVFVHALSPHKVVGWGVMLLAVILHQIFPVLKHNLLLYGGHPGVPLSDLADAGSFWIGAWTFRLYWGAFALLLLVLAHLFWRRGVDVRLAPRFARARQSLRGAPGWVAAAALVVFGTTGAVAYYNTNVLNVYRTSDEMVQQAVAFEREYGRYVDMPQPALAHLALNVSLFPAERRAEVKGSYTLRNLTPDSIADVHMRMVDRNTVLVDATFPGARLVRDDTAHGYRIYRLDRVMAPGEERTFSFVTRRVVRGFRNDWPETQLIENGTFLNETQLAPVIGTNRYGMINDAAERKELGLPALPPAPTLEDTATWMHASNNRGWATADITVSTSADQTPLAAGNKVSDVTTDGRRTAHFVSPTPIRARFVVMSARYAEQHRRYKGVEFSVYYHKSHAWNVPRMLDAMQQSLDYYQANFGPYQFDHFRIVEFPGYNNFAQAFAGTIPFSESVGFIADYQKAESIDQVTGMTAHEFAHQWWAHQVAAAEVEGEGVLSETMSQYAAHMVMKHTEGESQVRRFLQFELDQYLKGRNDHDPPLARTRGQYFLLYRKGALVMYLLQQRLGEDAVNRALKSLVTRFRFKSAPYATTLDLLAALRAEATTPEQQALITDLFERVTLYDLHAESPTAVQRPDGRWDVTLTVDAKKMYADTSGTLTEAPLSEGIEVGLFTAEPGRDAFDSTNVLLFERRPIKSGRQVLTFITSTRPTFAGVDPYNFYIDRRSWDNVAPVR